MNGTHDLLNVCIPIVGPMFKNRKYKYLKKVGYTLTNTTTRGLSIRCQRLPCPLESEVLLGLQFC